MSPHVRRRIEQWARWAAGLPLLLIAILLLSGELGWVPGLLILATLAPGAFLFNRYVLKPVPQQEKAKPAVPNKMDRLARYADSIIQSSPDVVVIIDTAHKVEEANRAARRMFGEEIDGKNFFQILRQPEAVTAMERALVEAAQGSTEIMMLSPGERHFILNVVPMRATAEENAEPQPVAGAFVVLHEITALKRSEQMRADFVANASHELRTPLASLIGFIETLQGPAQEDAEAREKFLEIMAKEASRMRRLIDDLLSLSRIELNEHVSPEDAVDVRRVIDRAIESLSPQAESKTMRFDVDISDEIKTVIGDQDQLNQIFVNLIDNAIKYGRSDSLVTIKGERVSRVGGAKGPATAISIFNEGKGIAREHLPRLTDRFYRVDTARSRDLGGTGLGLAIVKHIVNRHRGELEIDSTLGVGTTIKVTLPAANRALGGETASPDPWEQTTPVLPHTAAE